MKVRGGPWGGSHFTNWTNGAQKDFFFFINKMFFLVDFTKVDDINNLNTVGNFEEEPGITAPGKIGTHSLEDFSDGSFYYCLF